ncbi:MAG: polyketide cyclase [Elusimicrobia bacterium CG08_land_8_20_14_0_20_51_18]|nr:MAG: polyketide cyclase [Elusimicrobia bacterium CG08_land_8_20_14_0_20_51_18]
MRFEDAYPLLHDDFTAEWPQSGELFRGAKNFIETNRNYPGKFLIEVLKIRHAGETVISEVSIKPEGGTPLFAVSFYEFSGGKILKAVEYFPDTYPAPEWRAKWASKILS